MGKFSSFPIILTGYADMICKKHGKRARQICQSKEYQAIFGTTISTETKAADLWQLENFSEYLSSGLQSGLTGNRCGGLIWDDPVKGRRAAESRAEQDATWDAYRDDARTRKIPSAWEVGIGTRWHQRDLHGRILPEEWAGQSGYMQGIDGNLWYVLCVPAEAEHESDPLGRQPGEMLWSDWFPDAYWEPLRLDARSWGSLYQQVPTPPEGDFIKQEWVRYYDVLPKHLKHYLSGDYAVTRAEDADDPDWSEIGDWAVDPEGYVYYVDGWEGRVSADVWIEHMLDMVDNYSPVAHIAGGGQIRRGIEPFIKKRMRDRKVFVNLVWYPETHGKEENARTFQALMAAGMVYWPRGNARAERIIRQLVGFPTLTHDDAFDMCAMLGRHLAKIWGGLRPKPPEEKPIITAPVITFQDLEKRSRQKQKKW
jgi:predicted phage terminase large subunit-like protein